MEFSRTLHVHRPPCPRPAQCCPATISTSTTSTGAPLGRILGGGSGEIIKSELGAVDQGGKKSCEKKEFEI